MTFGTGEDLIFDDVLDSLGLGDLLGLFGLDDWTALLTVSVYDANLGILLTVGTVVGLGEATLVGPVEGTLVGWVTGSSFTKSLGTTGACCIFSTLAGLCLLSI